MTTNQIYDALSFISSKNNGPSEDGRHYSCLAKTEDHVKFMNLQSDEEEL